MILRAEAFEPWRCDRTCQLGIHLEHMNKVLKCMGGKDELEVKYKDGGDECDFVFKSPDEARLPTSRSSSWRSIPSTSGSRTPNTKPL